MSEIVDSPREETPSATTAEAEGTVPSVDAEETTSPIDGAAISPEAPPKAEDRLFTQAELDAAIGKRLARERRQLEREYAARSAQPATPNVPDGPLSQDQFESFEAYQDALAEQKAVKIVKARDQQAHQTEVSTVYAEREEEARGKYDDFETVAYNQNLRITDAMAEVIFESEIGPEMIYHLGSNPKEAERIANLRPFLQAKEIGRLEAKLIAEPPVKKTSGAPAPITPVKPKANGALVYDTTDPRSIDTMDTAQWIEAERQRVRKKAEARYR